MKIDILSLFPFMFDNFLNTSIIKTNKWIYELEKGFLFNPLTFISI